MTNYYRRTYEPLKFLGRLFLVPLHVTPRTSPVSYAPTWEEGGQHWGPTLIGRIPLTRWALGIGIWLNFDPTDVVAVHEDDAAYAAYQAVNGEVPREKWEAARRKIAEMGLNPDEEMELMQAMGVFQ